MLLQHLNQQQLDRTQAGLRRTLRVVAGPSAPHLPVQQGDASPQDYLSFCSNDYLGLANHPTLVQALIDGARRWGVSSAASHLISGHTEALQALENDLALAYQPFIPDAKSLLFSSGYHANLALLTALGQTDAVVFSDALNHASIIDGARLARARIEIYPHADMQSLRARLQACTAAIKLIVTDAVFSMDGDIAPVAELLTLAQSHDAWIVLDDAHGFGVLGAHGLGTLEHLALKSERLIYMATLGKAAGAAGAFVVAHPAVVDALVQSARSYIYTTALPPALAVAAQASLALITQDEGQGRRAQLDWLVTTLRQGMSRLLAQPLGKGLSLMPSTTAIQPLVVGSNECALALSQSLQTAGIWVPAIRPPTVPVGQARLRISLSAAHTVDDVQQLLAALEQALQNAPLP